jgi:hypothetical protein
MAKTGIFLRSQIQITLSHKILDKTVAWLILKVFIDYQRELGMLFS